MYIHVFFSLINHGGPGGIYSQKLKNSDKLKNFVLCSAIFGIYQKMEILSSKLGEGLYLLHIAVHLNSQPGIANIFHSYMVKNNDGRG